MVVISGLLQRYNVSAEGRRQIHSFYIAGDTPCLETLHIDYMDNSLGAVAAGRIGIVSHGELHRVMEARPKLRALIWRETLVQGAIFRLWLMRNSQMLAHAALAHFFCEMVTRARAAGLSDGLSMDLPLTQEDVADALGMTGVHVNRTLSLLRTGNLADFRGGRLTVPDWDRLAETAEFDPRYLHRGNKRGARERAGAFRPLRHPGEGRDPGTRRRRRQWRVACTRRGVLHPPGSRPSPG